MHLFCKKKKKKKAYYKEKKGGDRHRTGEREESMWSQSLLFDCHANDYYIHVNLPKIVFIIVLLKKKNLYLLNCFDILILKIKKKLF